MAAEDTVLSSHRPYLIRAIREWAIDNHLTPQLLVSAEMDGVEVPAEFVEEGQIVLNISPQAVDHLEMGNEYISFSARFRGVSRSVLVPVDAVLAVFDRESRQGMSFPSRNRVMTPGRQRARSQPRLVKSPISNWSSNP